MSKIRSDSLFAKLSPEQRETVFTWLYDECLKVEKVVELIEAEFGVKTSMGGVSGFLSRHGVSWRLERAKQMACEMENSLPKNHSAQLRRALSQREFEAAFRDLSTKELVMLRQLDQNERELALKEKIEPAKLKNQQRRTELLQEQVELQTRRIELLEKREAQAKETLGDGTLTPADKEARMKQFFGIA